MGHPSSVLAGIVPQHRTQVDSSKLHSAIFFYQSYLHLLFHWLLPSLMQEEVCESCATRGDSSLLAGCAVKLSGAFSHLRSPAPGSAWLSLLGLPSVQSQEDLHPLPPPSPWLSPFLNTIFPFVILIIQYSLTNH